MNSTPDKIQSACFNRLVLQSAERLFMPIAMYPGLTLTKASVRDVVTNPQAQVAIQAALQERYRVPILMSAMDLSAEAEAFGCEVQFSDGEVPTVVGRLITSTEMAQSLRVPEVGTKRTWVYLEAVRELRKLSNVSLVLGESIGPFSLAARLTGVAEAMELTMTNPGLIHTLLEKATEFLTAYARAFQSAGAGGLIMAEPAAGLLSPKSLAMFSSAYVKRLATAFEGEDFSIILHNCGAKLVHLPAILASGVQTFHFGAPMDFLGALRQVSSETVLCGNLDPMKVFCELTPAEITRKVAGLVQATRANPNCVISSGCDLPPHTPLANLDAFYRVAQEDGLPEANGKQGDLPS